jgi:hypothetical protein
LANEERIFAPIASLMKLKYDLRKAVMMNQAVANIFSYSFVFLIGVIVGAVGELVYRKWFGKSSTPAAPVPPQRIEIPQINVGLPSAPPPPANFTMPMADNSSQVASLIQPPPLQPAKPSKEDAKKPPKVLSIVEQVDELLQELQRFSKNNRPNISLLDDGKSGVIVKVGSQSYPGIDAVTDLEAQALIRQAVAEWEKRSVTK